MKGPGQGHAGSRDLGSSWAGSNLVRAKETNTTHNEVQSGLEELGGGSSQEKGRTGQKFKLVTPNVKCWGYIYNN